MLTEFSKRTFELCEKHLDDTNSNNTEIENIFVKHLLILICAERENKIKKVFEKKIEDSTNSISNRLASFLIKNTFKDINYGTISGYIRNFGDEKRERLDSKRDDRIVTSWNNIINNRHIVAHGLDTIQLTFHELKEEFERSENVLIWIADALEIQISESKPPKNS